VNKTASAQRALVVGSGDRIDKSRLVSLAEESAHVIAADGGLVFLQECGIDPTAVIGDFDSVPKRLLETVPVEKRHFDPGQDDTDLEKAIRFAVGQGASHIDVVGATGGRLDHTFNAVSLLLKFDRQNVGITLHDACGQATLCGRSPMLLSGRVGDRISLIPAPQVVALQSDGLRFPLESLSLGFGTRDAVSNVLDIVPATIRWKSGTFLLYRQDSPS